MISAADAITSLLQGLGQQAVLDREGLNQRHTGQPFITPRPWARRQQAIELTCLLYTSDAADE